jgi:hypothetical protein
MLSGLAPQLIDLVPRDIVSRLYQIFGYGVTHISQPDNADGFPCLHQLITLLIFAVIQ